jgi:hypothetical protein
LPQRVVVPEEDDERPILRPRGHVSEFLPLAEVLPAARARRADEPLVRASQGLRWEEPAGAQLASLEVERPQDVAPAQLPPAERPAAVATAGPIAVAGAAWAGSAAHEPRVSTHRQLALLGGAVGMFLVSVVVVVAVLVTGRGGTEAAPAEAASVVEAGPGAGASTSGGELPGGAPKPAAELSGELEPLGAEAAAAPRPADAAGKDGNERPARPPAAPQEAPTVAPVDRAPPPAKPPPEVLRADPPPPKAPKAVKVTEGMRAVSFRFNGDWGGGTAQVSCGARFHLEKPLSGSGARMEIKPETCEATVRCAEGGGRTSLTVRASATEVVCSGCTADAPQPVCSVR